MTIGEKYFLGDGIHYFIYRTDQYNIDTIRVDLFTFDNTKIYSSLVKGGMTEENKSEQFVINELELFVQEN